MSQAKTRSSKPQRPNTDAVVAEARTWTGTPYRHQHSAKGVAVDCVGLIIGVGMALDILPDWSPEAWAEHESYSRAPNPEHMGRAIRQFMEPIDLDPAELAPPGSVAFMAWRANLPMHLGIIGRMDDGRPTLIHAFEYVGRVVEHGFDQEWPGRVESWWKFPGLSERT